MDVIFSNFSSGPHYKKFLDPPLDDADVFRGGRSQVKVADVILELICYNIFSNVLFYV